MRRFGLLMLLLLAILLLLITFPAISPDASITSIGAYVLILTTAAVAWNIFSGFTGYINLGSAVYLGIGGYAMAILCQDWHIPGGYTPFLLLPLVGLIAAICAIPLGWLALRVRRHTFMVLTIAIFYVGQYLAYNLDWLTGGSQGIFLPNPPWSADFFDVPFYYVALILFVLAIGISWWMRSSKYGLGLLAIRDDEDRARGIGITTWAYKLGAYVVSSFFIGMLGALTIYYVGSIYPEAGFTPSFDVIVALMVFLGGVGTVIGPVVGGLLVVPLQQYLILQYGTTPLEPFFYGGLLLAVILLLPEGIVPALRKKWTNRESVQEAKRAAMTMTDPSRQEPPAFSAGSDGKG